MAVVGPFTNEVEQHALEPRSSTWFLTLAPLNMWHGVETSRELFSCWSACLMMWFTAIDVGG
jgi:hypothetical protein